MTAPRWAKVHEDGPSHAWPADLRTGLVTAVCGVEADAAELIDTRDDPCMTCSLVHGGQLAERHGDSAWR